MHRGVTNDDVTVPACAVCADLLDDRDRCDKTVAHSLAVAGASGLAVAIVVGLWWSSWLAGTTGFVVCAGGGFVLHWRNRRRVARWHDAWGHRRLTIDHPDVLRRKANGWLEGRAARWTTPAAVIAPLVFKKCSFCGEVAPTNAHPGERCAHCGALWTQELWGRRAS